MTAQRRRARALARSRRNSPPRKPPAAEAHEFPLAKGPVRVEPAMRPSYRPGKDNRLVRGERFDKWDNYNPGCGFWQAADGRRGRARREVA